MKNLWHTSSVASCALAATDIHIWRVDLNKFIDDDAAIAEFWQILSVHEHERALRFVQKQHQLQFIITHGILRKLIAAYGVKSLQQTTENNNDYDLVVNCKDLTPSSIVFSQNAYGKPGVKSLQQTTEKNNDYDLVVNCKDLTPLQFNLSHTKNLAVFAFTLNNPIGIDVEFIKEKIDFIDIARRFFAPREVEAILRMPDAVSQKLAFFNCWTRKEAFIKAIGRGLSFPLNKFSVDARAIASDERVKIEINDTSYNSAQWELFTFDPAPNYVGAVAVSQETTTKTIAIKYFNFE
jgi:4'-phosphopantetheinyl transferase